MDPGPDATSGLRAYILAKQEVTDAVRVTAQALQGDGGTEATGPYHDLLARLAEDRFNLAVVGQFKRGKSTLMNAIIGRDLLPTGVLPLTSAITALCYGPRERVLLRRKGWAREQEIQLGELADYVTERGNPGNEKGLSEARVELPLPFLRRGLYFIDTPGVGSGQHENTATTRAFLPQADAVIFVTSVEAPLSEAEELFLRDIREHAPKLFVVVNKVDVLAGDERDEVLAYIGSRLSSVLAADGIPIFPVSARQALAATLRRDAPALQDSGLAELEASLATFLANEQGRTFLVAILDRLIALVPDGQDDRSLEQSGDRADPGQTAGSLRDSAQAIRARLLSGGPLAVEPAADDPSALDGQAVERAIVASGLRHPSATERTTSRAATCPVCAAQGDAIFRFFAQWQYQLATSRLAQREFSAARGFCPAHSWQLGQIASPQGMSAGYVLLIESTAAELQRIRHEPAAHVAARLAALFPTAASCAACQVLEEVERSYVAQTLGRLDASDGRDDRDEAEGLCLPHLQVALASDPGATVGELLIGDQVRRLEELAEDMHSYSLKREAVRRGLLNEREEHAWRRALVQLVGERIARGVTLPQHDRT